WELSWNTGEQLWVGEHGGFFDWSVVLGPNDGPGSVQGLLGSKTGRANDFQRPDGSVLHGSASDSAMLGDLADAWRVTPGTSLLVQAMAATLVASEGNPSASNLGSTSSTASDFLAPSHH
ncbi:MAG: hypothetical protein JO339_34790, partial [Alphaproteobacteria bacterium]|nr:hypothetical protein [Alphaproteobacteria bacterium]